MGKYYSINKFSKILGVLAQTLRNWEHNGKLVKELIGEGGEDDDKNN